GELADVVAVLLSLRWICEIHAGTPSESRMWVATRARCADGEPKICSVAVARLKCRCAGCSVVKPMPPSTWMHIRALAQYASLAVAFATAALTSRSSVAASHAQAA